MQNTIRKILHNKQYICDCKFYANIYNDFSCAYKWLKGVLYGIHQGFTICTKIKNFASTVLLDALT